MNRSAGVPPDTIADNHARVLSMAAAACARVGRDPAGVTIIGVTKTKPVAAIEEAARAGLTDVGENYVQEFTEKHAALGDLVRWHFIGHLQRNKVRVVAPIVSMIHAVDSERLGAEIDRWASATGRRLPVLLQVNTSGEESKFGVTPEGALPLARALAAMPGLDLRGLMTLAAFLDDPEGTRPMFRLLRETRDRLRQETSLDLPDLSMGMTNDFEVAVEEGATFVRVGTAIFGERLYPPSRG